MQSQATTDTHAHREIYRGDTQQYAGGFLLVRLVCTLHRRRTRKSRARVGKDFSEFLVVIGAIMTCVIAPVLTFFLHSLYKVLLLYQ